MEIYILFPANDVALCVVGARVGSVYGGHIVSTAVAVVCERGVNPALFVNINPLWAVHFGGAQQVAGLARFNQNFGLIRKAIGRCERTLAMCQCHPLAFTVCIELGDIQRAVIEQGGVGCSAT